MFNVKDPYSKIDLEIGLPDPDVPPEKCRELPGYEIKIYDILTSEENKTFTHEYYFSDAWIHLVEFEGIFYKDKDTKYPTCLEGRRACPPGDCGGIWLYQDVIKNFSKASVAANLPEMITWNAPDNFDPAHFSKDEVVFENPKSRFERMLDSYQLMGHEAWQTGDDYKNAWISNSDRNGMGYAILPLAGILGLAAMITLSAVSGTLPVIFSTQLFSYILPLTAGGVLSCNFLISLAYLYARHDHVVPDSPYQLDFSAQPQRQNGPHFYAAPANRLHGCGADSSDDDFGIAMDSRRH